VPQTAEDIDPEHDDKYSYIFNNWDRLKEIKRHILFTDGDEQGERLRDEIARRLGRVRCSFVASPTSRARSRTPTRCSSSKAPAPSAG